MTAIHLEIIGENIFKASKFLEQADIKLKDLLKNPQKFILAARVCDGSYHKVNSEISTLFEKRKDKLTTGNFMELINDLSPDETIHGQRFVIFQESKKQAYLLGDVVSALSKFGK